MLLPANFEEKIGFDKIRNILLEKCFSSLGRKQISKIQFQTDAGLISPQLHQTEEFRQILLRHLPFPGSDYFDPEVLFHSIRPADTYAEPENFLDLMHSLRTILGIIRFLDAKDEKDSLRFPSLAELTKELNPPSELVSRIDYIIDENARVRDRASDELKAIRDRMQKLEQQAGKRINQYLSEGKMQGWISSDTELSLRNGRLVIPVSATHKRKIRGFIHDQSATGQTVFLEPEEVFAINNELRELEAEERREVIRVLKELASLIRPHLQELEACYYMLGCMDAIRSKARLAIEMDALMPRLSDKPGMEWINARHPLLYLAYKPLGKHVEPLSLRLQDDSRILVISGPNAGGKSVCLKTCGLLQYMLQCGLLVPMADYSEAGIFHQIMIDIGDQQSLENDLSTYSSHLLNMKHFISLAGSQSLFLIDEFGAGTEPRIGGAIAESILEELNLRAAFGVVTTHYANLKLMAGRCEGIQNGSMLFDSKNMRPLFKLRTGHPGSSFAFEIARTIGLPDKLLSRAEELTGLQELDFDRQLQDLEVTKAELIQKEKELRSAESFLSDMIDRYEKLLAELEGKKSEIMIKARQEAKSLLSGTNRLIENTIRQIRESQAEREATRNAREEIRKQTKELEESLNTTTDTEEKPKKAKKKPVNRPQRAEGPISAGDTVRIIGQENLGEVMEVSQKEALIMFGNLKMRSPLAKLEKIKRESLPEAATSMSGKKRGKGIDLNEKAAAFSPSIDLRGMRAEEALHQLEQYLDDARLLSAGQVNILHGKGDGILRKLIREYLARQGSIHRFRDEHPDRGGAGITIVDFS